MSDDVKPLDLEEVNALDPMREDRSGPVRVIPAHTYDRLLATARAGLEDRERQDALQGQEGFLPGDLVEWSDENVKGMRGKVLRVENLVLVEDTDEPAARFWLDMRDWPDKLQTRLVGRGVPTRSGRREDVSPKASER